MGTAPSKKKNLTKTVPSLRQYNPFNIDKNLNIINNLKNIAIKDLKNATINVVECNNPDNLGTLWKCIKMLKQDSLITNVLQLLNTQPKMESTLIQLLTTYIDIIVILIRRDSLILAASVIAIEASSLALCIAIYVKMKNNNISSSTNETDNIKRVIDEMPAIIQTLQEKPPSKIPKLNKRVTDINKYKKHNC